MTSAEIERLKQQSRDNVYTPHGDVARADCVIGFSFGYREVEGKIVPGKTNEQLAEFIETHCTHLPFILQFEINDALTNRSAELVIRESRQKGEYLNSREIALQAQEYMAQKGWQRAVLVTHPAMEARNDAICTKLGMTTLLPAGLEVIEYDLESAQPWTRDKASWWQREETVIDTCAEHGWI